MLNPHFEKEIDDLIEKAKEAENYNSIVIIGDVAARLISEAQKFGLNLNGYRHNIDVYGIKHSFKRHGNKEKEALHGQLPITDEDIKNTNQYVYNYDSSSFGEKNEQGRDIIKFYKQMPDGCILYISEVRTRRHTLTLNSIRKYKNRCF